MNVSAKSIILEILSVAPLIHGPSVPVRILVKAADVFEVAENSVRVAIVRLRAEGLVESEDRGQYQLGQVQAWDGSWLACFTADLSRTDRPALRRRQQALKMAGFRRLRPGLHVRPANLKGDLAFIGPRLRQLGMEDSAVVFRIAGLEPAEESRARGLWDKKALRAVYRDMKEQLEASSRRIDQMGLEDAVREAFLVGREAVRWVVLDPLLPDELVAADERRALVATLEAYSDRGLDLWRDFLNLEDEG
jgi:phenylacetic acid degradation operon negative regulatory protein